MASDADLYSRNRYIESCPNGPTVENLDLWIDEAERELNHPDANTMFLGEWASEFGPALVQIAKTVRKVLNGTAQD